MQNQIQKGYPLSLSIALGADTEKLMSREKKKISHEFTKIKSTKSNKNY